MILYEIGKAVMTYLFILTIGLLATIDAATVHAGNNEAMLETLFERITKLEVNDVADKREIAALKSEMNDMKMTFMAKEERLLAEIDSLKTELRKNAVAEDENETKRASSTKIDRSGHKDVGTTMKKAFRTDGLDGVRTVERSIKGMYIVLKRHVPNLFQQLCTLTIYI